MKIQRGCVVARLLSAAFVSVTMMTPTTHLGIAHAAGRAYEEVKNWAPVPTAPQEISAVATDSGGNVYALQRGPGKVIVYNMKGQQLRGWGDGVFPNGHGLRIDRQNNVWVTDRDLHQVLKYTTDGKLLMSLGTKGVAGDNNSTTSFNRPSDVVIGRNGDIFVSDGESTNSRVVKFSKDGKFVKSWGTKGAGPGQLNVPHSIAMDSRGRLYVASRSNQRVEIFNQDGGYLGQITNVGAPAGLFITGDNVIYITDGTKDSEGLTVMDTRNQKILGHIGGLAGVHMISVDRTGAVYVAELEYGIKKFVRK